jgi:hypothetical protein
MALKKKKNAQKICRRCIQNALSGRLLLRLVFDVRAARAKQTGTVLLVFI